MNTQKNPSDTIWLKNRLITLFAVMVLFGLVTGLTFLHTMNTLADLRQLEEDYDACFNTLHRLDDHLMDLGVAYADSVTDPSETLSRLNSDLTRFREQISGLAMHPAISTDTLITSALTDIRLHAESLEKEIVSRVSSHPAVDLLNEYGYLQDHFIRPMEIIRIGVRSRIYDISYEKQRFYSSSLMMLMFFSVLSVALLVMVNIINNSRNAGRLLHFVRALEQGRIPGRLRLTYGREYAGIAQSLNQLLDKQEEKVRYLKTIGEQTDPEPFNPPAGDVIGTEIKIMAERLRKTQQEEKERKEADRIRNWTAEGIAEFADILRSERENVSELSFLVIRKLVTYLKIEMGTIFLTADQEGEEKQLETIAAYAYDRRKYLQKRFAFGEGLPGTCALEKEKIYIDEIPDSYSDVISGVGQAKPRVVLLVPMKIEGEVFGIIELASFRKLEDHELALVDHLAESIATTLLSVKTNERTAALLRQSRLEAEKLLQQEQEMKDSLAGLEKSGEESRRKASEMTGILNAMNESTLVAEFSLNGRFIRINEKFLQLLGSPADTVLGKHHNEFAVTDKYSDAYRSFWEELKKGNSLSREEQFRCFTGQEVWLQQSFTPIRNEEGKVYKILNIAVDITQARQQQENLEKQAAEIRRQNREMETLNQAVNSAIIKCELDREGIILDTNSNFEEVSGLNRREILGRNYRLFLKDMEKEQFEKIWTEVLKGKTYEGATRRTKPTGEEVWLMSNFSPVKDEDGAIYKIWFLALDITEKKLKYQLLEDANREIERLRAER